MVISRRFSGVRAAARAAAPLAPPSFPNATAAGFFVDFSNGVPSIFSPMAVRPHDVPLP